MYDYAGCVHDHAPIGRCTKEEMAAYCRVNGITPVGPLLAVSEYRTGPHPRSNAPSLSTYSPLLRSGRYTEQRLRVPKTFFNLTKAERATLIGRPLTYTKFD
jgi:hypothetical protein